MSVSSSIAHEPADGTARDGSWPSTAPAPRRLPPPPPEPAAAAARRAAAAARGDDEPVLEVRGVSKSFAGRPAIEGLDLEIRSGMFYGLVGPNGAGKTTTLSMVAGLLRPDRGTIRVRGVDAVAQQRRASALVGVLPDRLRTFDRLTGAQLLQYYGLLRGMKAPLVRARAADLARAFGLVDVLGRSVSDYSAGMRKKVLLAGAMIHSPRLLVLDEPFASVDPISAAMIMRALVVFAEHGGAVMLASHALTMIEQVCNRVAVLAAGHVLAEGPVGLVRGERTLMQRYEELTGGVGEAEDVEWLHSFSG